ncbi:MAG: LemA family protein [Clostridia bacterium]|nr:LemA family protein [Clostridia bacterium]
MKKTWLIVIALVAFLGLWLFSGYNNLVTAEENVNSKWGQVENQLQRRGDLIGNLVETVKGYVAHEQKVFGQIAEARARLAGAQTPARAAQATGELEGALSRLLVVVENYPNLKADTNFRALMDELAGSENRIAVARKDYNEAVQYYNTSIRRFPTVIMANTLGFGPKEYFKAEERAKEVPKVRF